MYNSSLSNLISSGVPSDEKAYLDLVASKGFEMSELEPIIKSDGRSMLLATAGAGKSTALSLLYAKDKLYGYLSNARAEEFGKKRAWVTTFLGSGASELQHNIEKTLADLELFQVTTSGTSFKTIHAEFLELLTVVGGNFSDKSKPNYRAILDGGGESMYALEERILNKIFREFNLGRDSRFIQPRERSILKGIISRYRNTVLSEYHFGDAEEDARSIGLRLSSLPAIVESYQKTKLMNEVIDFDDMLKLVYDLFCHPEDPQKAKFYKLYTSRYHYLLLDEAQDMSELQYLALKPLFENCPRVVIVGDPDQSIYGFRGANSEVMSWFNRDFEPSVYPLSVSYRCPSEIMTPMARVIKNNEGRFDTTPRSFKEGGICKAYGFHSSKEMIDACLDLIDDALANDKTVTVLSRVNFTYSPASISYAIKKGIYFNLLGDIRSLSTSAYKRVWSLIEMVRGRGLESLKTNLKVLDPEIKNWDAKEASQEFLNIIPKNGNIMTYLDVLSESVNSKSLYRLHEKFVDLMERSGNKVDEMEAFRLLLDHVRYWGTAKDVEVVDTIMALVDESPTVDDFFTNMDFVNNAIIGAKNHQNGVSPLTFATPFGFKGKESDVIISFDTSAGVFPYVLSGEYNYDEERRVFFVTGTRAKKEMYYLTRTGKESPFLLESGIPVELFVPRASNKGIVNNTKSLKERMEEQAQGVIAKELENFSLDDWGI